MTLAHASPYQEHYHHSLFFIMCKDRKIEGIGRFWELESDRLELFSGFIGQDPLIDQVDDLVKDIGRIQV